MAKMVKKIIVGMSGGVDSSVSAWLLQQQGYEVEGFFMKNWQDDDLEDEHCSSTADLIDVMRVCEQLNIPLHADNFTAEYQERVFSNFLEEYAKGRTPNPDILCNREIKFKVLLDKAKQLGADYLATGHYADINYHDQQYHLMMAKDNNKDQTYFLYTLNQEQLSQSLFPLAQWQKPQVRQQAAELNLQNHAKKDSTGICFIGNRRFQQFLSKYMQHHPAAKVGAIIDDKGNTIGEHQGAVYYTIGQRQGLGIGGSKNGTGKPWYVADKNLTNNQLICVQGADHPLLNHCYLSADNLSWTNDKAQEKVQNALQLASLQETPASTSTSTPTNTSASTPILTARIRHRQPLQAVRILPESDHQSNPEQLTVQFDRPQFAIAAGQSIVLYQGKECLGGGIIKQYW